MGGAVKDYNGKNNPFYGKTHTKESIEKIRQKNMNKYDGDKNPFYGKVHSEETKKIISEKNKQYIEKNKELLLKKRLASLSLTKEKLIKAYNDYLNTEINLDNLQESLNVDKRVICKYIEYFRIATKKSLPFINIKKR